MSLFILSIIIGLIALLWSSIRFVEGSSAIANFYGMSPLLIGMVVVGFGTSAPELLVSAIAAYKGSHSMALGNAYGSNIGNIAFILGLVAIFKPIEVNSKVLKKELPVLLVVTILSALLAFDLLISRTDATLLIFTFVGLVYWSIRTSKRNIDDPFALEIEAEIGQANWSLKKQLLNLIVGFIILIASSRLLVFGAEGIAISLGVSEAMIGLTIIALGTSLPELASSLIAARKGESEIALGNIIGSNLFNTLAVVGVSGLITPLRLEMIVLKRDIMFMLILTISLFFFSYGLDKARRINRVEGAFLLVSYIIYTVFLIKQI